MARIHNFQGIHDSLKVGNSFHMRRCRLLSALECTTNEFNGPIFYWMSRDQRAQDNWALVYAQQLALKHSVPLMVGFCLIPKFLDATWRQYSFMLNGLQEVEKELTLLKIPFHLFLGLAQNCLPTFVERQGVSVVVCDFSPLRFPLGWVKNTANELDKRDIPLIQVDAHNIVPVWVTSEKQEYAARTIRNKIHKVLPEYLTDFPAIVKHPYNESLSIDPIDWSAAFQSLEVDKSVKEVDWATPGTVAGLQMLEEFCEKRLKSFSALRNDPNANGLSNLSPWFHFGQLSIQRSILRVKQFSSQFSTSVSVFIEEAVVRRELADNFCFYNNNYDNINGAPAWAQETLRKDKREYLYSQEQFETSSTHDPLWNAAQLQMVQEGKMHGFMRMYWAKKILEWTESPEEALRIAIYLNNRYELDGRDPNGYVGCMWSICGVHDQGWAERKVFGKIRYMNYEGCKRKFDVSKYERKYVLRKRQTNDEDAVGIKKYTTKKRKIS